MWNDRVLVCDALSTIELIKHRSKREDNDEWPVDKDLEEDGRGVPEGCLRRMRKAQKTSIKEADSPGQIRARYIANIDKSILLYRHVVIAIPTCWV
jgi:hypothetical protein